MAKLYKGVLREVINKLPAQFSNDLYEVVSLLIQVNSNKRPNCNVILNNNIVKKRIDYFNSMSNKNDNEDDIDMDEKEEQSLLKTIHIPKNLLYLSNQLPKPNYNKNRVINKSNTACELEINNINKNSFPIINKAKSTLPNININKKTNEDNKVSIDMNNNNKLNNCANNENETNNNINISINNNNNNDNDISNHKQYDVKREVQFYKKLYAINNRQIKPIKKNKIQDKNILYNYNNYNNYNNMQSHKLYKLYEPYKNIPDSNMKKLQKYRIGNNNNLRNNKYNIYLKNREELYKKLYKNMINGNSLPKIKHNNNSCLNIGENNNGANNQLKNEIKIIQNRNRLSPIIKNVHCFINS